MKMTFTVQNFFFFIRIMAVIFFPAFLNEAYGQTSVASNAASSFTTSSTAGGTAWSNPAQAQHNDNVFTTCLITGSNKPTFNLNAQGWGFQTTNTSGSGYIPANAVINGIEVTVRLRKTLSGVIRDDKITLLKAGTEIAANKARSSVNWPTAAASITYGSSTDSWGTSWTASDIVNANFGVRVVARNRGREVQAEIDYISVTVYFNQKYYYSKSTGNLEQLATWGLNTNGSGTAPADFSTAGQVFFLRNRSTATLNTNLNITGTDSKIVVGDGVATTTLTVPANYVLNSAVEIADNSSLTVSNTTVPQIRIVGNNTTVTYNAIGNQTMADVNYFNLTVAGSAIKYLTVSSAGSTNVYNSLVISAGAQLHSLGNDLIVSGILNPVNNNGTFSGSGKLIYSTQDVSASFSGSGTYSNLEIDAGTTGISRTITLLNPISVTDSLTLADGILSAASNLTMASGSKLKIAEGSLLGSLASSSNYDITYLPFSGTTKTIGVEASGSIRDLTVAVGSGNTILLSALATINRNFIISSGSIDPTANNFPFIIKGNFVNNANLVNRNASLSFTGNTPQIISGTTPGFFYNVVVNNAAGVQLTIPVTISNNLNLTNGIVTTSVTNPLILEANATITGGSANSYISGQLRQTVAALSGTRFFPIGKDGVYRPMTLAVTHNNTNASVYSAELFSGAAPSRTLPSSLKAISSVRYYTVNNSNLSSFTSAAITINYGADDNVTDPVPLRIAKSFGSQWLNIGGTATTAGSGTITSDRFYEFSDFTLSTYNDNSLPLTWGVFTAVKKPEGIVLNWRTYQEVNTSGFIVERSTDGKNWQAIGKRLSNNKEQNNYTFTDLMPAMLNYYRVKQVDMDGKFTYSKIIHQEVNLGTAGLAVHSNPVTGGSITCKILDKNLLMSGDVLLQIWNTSGALVFQMKTAPLPLLTVQTGGLMPGQYILSVQNSNKLQQVRFITQ